MTAETIHSCSYSCDRTECIRAQRDELAARLMLRFDLSPAQKEGAIREHLIRLGWTPPDEHAMSQPANDEVVFIDGVGAGRSSIESCRDGVQWIVVGDRVYWPLSDSDAKRLQSACCGNGSFDGPATPAAVDEAAAIRAFEEHFQASSDDPYFEGELELWLTAWRKALGAQQQQEAAPMADVELLPLPAIDSIVKYVEDYARANVEHHTAPLQAENERLRAEVERLNAELVRLEKIAGYGGLASDAPERMILASEVYDGMQSCDKWCEVRRVIDDGQPMPESATPYVRADRAERLAEALRELVDVFSESGMYDEEVFAEARAALAQEDRNG